MRNDRIVIIILLCVLLGSCSFAEPNIYYEELPKVHTLRFMFGYDESVATLGVGYSYTFVSKPLHRTVSFECNYLTPLFCPDFSDFQILLSSQVNAVQYKKFQIPVKIKLAFDRTENNVLRGYTTGMVVGIIPGYYSTKWFMGGECFWDQQLLSHLKHSKIYNNFYYNNRKDGWYKVQAHKIRLGVRMGYTVPNNSMEFIVRGGYEKYEKNNAVEHPFYSFLTSNFFF